MFHVKHSEICRKAKFGKEKGKNCEKTNVSRETSAKVSNIVICRAKDIDKRG
jgi:hypothetical protein